MRQRLAMTALLVGLMGLQGPGPGWGQTAPRSPTSPAPAPARAAPKPRPADPLARPAGDDKNAPVTVDADQLENLQKEGLIVFTGNVVASQNNSTQYADRMEVYLDAKGDNIVRTVSTGNVRLIGNARVWRDDNVVTGERITLYLAEDRSVVEGGKQERVKAVFYPKSQEPDRADAKPAARAPCG